MKIGATFGSWMTATRDATASLGYTTWSGKGNNYAVSAFSTAGGNVYYAHALARSATDDGYASNLPTVPTALTR